MRGKKTICCSIVIISFLFTQSPGIAMAKFYAAAQESAKVTQNAPQFRTTPPEPIPTSEAKAGGKKGKVIWGIVGAAALVGLVAAMMSSGSSSDNGPDPEPTGEVQVEW